MLRDISVGGLHIHHLVYGIGLTLLAGFLEFRFQPDTPWFELLAIVFGIGAGLMLDEFALSLYMKDVYWADQGRSSVNAVLIALMIGGLFVIGTAPLELEDANDGSRLALAIAVGVNSLLASLALLKGKIVTGRGRHLHPRRRARRRDPPRQAALAVGTRALRAQAAQAGALGAALRADVRRPDEPTQGPPGRRAEQARSVSRLAP